MIPAARSAALGLEPWASLVAAPRLPGGIPKVVHRVHLGGDEPAEQRRFARRWQELHPGWRVVTWRDWSLPALARQAELDGARHASERSNVVRYELLRALGGVYVDTDVEPLQPLDEAVAEARAFVGREDDRWLGTAVIGAAPEHPWIVALHEGLPARWRRMGDRPSNVISGPKYASRVLQRHQDAGHDDVLVLPPSAFYPYHFSEPERAGGPFPGSLAVHHWSHSWAEAPSGTGSSDHGDG